MLLKGSCHCKAVKFEVNSRTPYPFMLCYCSICRKTAGGGGYAINIMGEADTLKVTGMRHVKIYRAILGRTRNNRPKRSTGRRHFCQRCASCLWISDPAWPDLVHPFASAIDTPLPIPKERVHIMLDYAADWCVIPKNKNEVCFAQYPEESIAEWHERHGLYVK